MPADLVLWDGDDADDVGGELEALAAAAFADDSDAPPTDVAGLDVDDWPERIESEADPLLQLAAMEAAAALDVDQRMVEVAELDDDTLLDAAAANQKAINTSQAHQLALAAQWADLHNADAIGPMVNPHGEGLIEPGGEGTPGFAEFAPRPWPGCWGSQPPARRI